MKTEEKKKETHPEAPKKAMKKYEYKEPELDYEKHYTYADYLTWFDDKMRELIGGIVRLMSLSSNRMENTEAQQLT